MCYGRFYHLNHFFTKCILLAIAAIIQGFSMAVFLFPHLIPSGGAASIAVLFHYLWTLPHGATIWIVNTIMLLAAARWLGKANALWTIYCVTITSVTIDLIALHVIGTVSFILVDLAIGSILFGIGVGILFRLGASSGGMDILALIISNLKGTSPGRTLFWINSAILTLTAIVVDWKIILFALACQWISSYVIDFIGRFNVMTVKSTIYNSQH